MATEDKKFHISPLTQKLMFKGGKMPEASAGAAASALMSDEALSVCQLLAIDPEDIMPRDVAEFQDPASKVSQQRLQLRHEYYEEKRQLKVKAIENILIKCQTTKAGQTSMEGQQVLALLNDIKTIQTPTKRSLYQSQNNGGESPTWRFMENSPHSPGRKPFVGGARQLFNSGVNYKKMISSTPAVRAQRVLDRMPRNILERDGQQGLHSMMTGTFVTQGAGLGEQPSSLPAAQNKRSALSATKGANVVEKRDDRVRTGSDMSVFDTFSYGFDLPAGVQLNRINRKLHYWETTRDHIEERKAQREMWAKELLKKEQRKENKMRDAFKQTALKRTMDWGKQNDARTGRIQKYNDNLAIDDKEVWHEVKRYYKELEEYAHDKKDKEKALTDRLVAYYNAASGAKAEEIRKRAEEHFRSIEDGQVLNAAVLEKLDQRVEKVAVDKEKKAHAVREINTVAEQVKYGVYEHDEQKAYDVLQKNYENDKRAVKAAKTHADQTTALRAKKKDAKDGKHYVAKAHQKEQAADLVEKREDLEEKYRNREEQVARQKKLVAQQKNEVAEKHKMHANDASATQQRLETLKNLRNFRILEKHTAKSRQIDEYNQSVQALSKLA